MDRNIAAMQARRQQDAANASRQEKTAEWITSFVGSMWFVYLHLAIYAAWIGLNLGIVPAIPKFDPSFVILAMEASVEAIFLSTFVLISQNRATVAADKRADLDLQINLLAEHELTRLATLVAAIAEKLDVPIEDPDALAEIQRDVAPETVLDALQTQHPAKEPAART